MNAKPLEGKVGLVFGVANKRSIAWAIAQAWAEAGAKLIFNYQGERLKDNVEELAGTFGADTPLYPCDVTKDEEVDAFFDKVATRYPQGRPAAPLRRLRPQGSARRRLRQHQPRSLRHRARHQRLFAGRISPATRRPS